MLSNLNLRQFAGQHLKTAKLYQAFQGSLSLEEIKTLQNFIDAPKQARSMDPDDVASADVGGDFVDMDELIEAIRLKHDLEMQPTKGQ